MVKYVPFDFLSSTDGVRIDAMAVVPEGGIKSVVQILHGMCEYKDRYYPFMEYLANKGCLVVIHDHRGHGNSINDMTELGYFYDGGAKGLIEDAHQLLTMVKSQVEDVPYIMIGHSMGSLIARCLVQRYDYEINKLIILGSPSKIFGVEALEAISPLILRKHGPKGHSKFLENVVNSAYEGKFKEENLIHSWLTTDREVVEWFNANPKCNFCFTVNGYLELGKLNIWTYSKKNWRVRNSSMPVLFLSGGDDPCYINRRAFGKSVHIFKDMGYTNVKAVLYKGLRHEILNEKSKKRVYRDIYDFIIK